MGRQGQQEASSCRALCATGGTEHLSPSQQAASEVFWAWAYSSDVFKFTFSKDRCADNLKSRMEDIRKEAIISREEVHVGTLEILPQIEPTGLGDGMDVGSEGEGG